MVLTEEGGDVSLKKIGLTIALAVAGTLALGILPAAAQEEVCPPLDSGKIDTTGEPLSVVVTAPEGFLISGYCVKAGSDESGAGVEFVTVDPPQESVTISHSSGKAVSHYSYSLVEIETPPTTPPTTPPEAPPGDSGGADVLGGTTRGGGGGGGAEGAQVTAVPSGGVATGGGSTAGPEAEGILALGIVLLVTASTIYTARRRRGQTA
jgi:hypothetical protein